MSNPPDPSSGNRADLKGKEPWIAVCLSRVFPGFGQMYGGAPVRGVLILLLFVGVAIAALYCLIGFIGPKPPSVLGIGLGLLLIPINIWNLFDAHSITRRHNSREFEAVRLSGKDPWRSVFFTSLLLGFGHLYIRRYIWAAVLIALGVVGFGIPLLGWVLAPIALCHAYWATPAGRSRPKSLAQGAKILLIAWFLPSWVGIAVFAAGIGGFQMPQHFGQVNRQVGISNFLIETTDVPSGSMLPTIEIGDRITINKFIYRIQDPARGDIIYFNPPEELSRQNFKDAFIKRIIGLPGETVEVGNGKVMLNGNVLEEDYILEPPSYAWGPKIVPPNSYFVLGDNRNKSYDSYYWGFVPRDKIIGKVTSH